MLAGDNPVRSTLPIVEVKTKRIAGYVHATGPVCFLFSVLVLFKYHFFRVSKCRVAADRLTLHGGIALQVK